MRLFEIDGTNIDDEAQNIANVLMQECGPYISTMNDMYPHQLYRGVRPMLNPFGKYPCPVNRKPKDTQPIAHNIIDNYFRQATGIAFRSNAVFATGKKILL